MQATAIQFSIPDPEPPPDILFPETHTKGASLKVRARCPLGEQGHRDRPASVATVPGILETVQRASLPALLGAQDLKANDSDAFS